MQTMYAVIFQAETDVLDETYFDMAAQLRSSALDEYGCSEFVSVIEGGQEISISYWETQEQIRAWKQDAEHQCAQRLGRSKWYKYYKVQVVEIIREHKKNT